MTGYIDIVFDGPPSHESGRFVEVEDANGISISIGEWIQRPDGWDVLRIPDPRPDTADADTGEPDTNGHHDHLDHARRYLDAQIGGNSQWTGPHPEWTAHTIAVIVEAGLRDIVNAVRSTGDRIGDAVDAHANELGRQRT